MTPGNAEGRPPAGGGPLTIGESVPRSVARGYVPAAVVERERRRQLRRPVGHPGDPGGVVRNGAWRGRR